MSGEIIHFPERQRAPPPRRESLTERAKRLLEQPKQPDSPEPPEAA